MFLPKRVWREAFQTTSLRTGFGFGKLCQKGTLHHTHQSPDTAHHTPHATPPRTTHHTPHTSQHTPPTTYHVELHAVTILAGAYRGRLGRPSRAPVSCITRMEDEWLAELEEQENKRNNKIFHRNAKRVRRLIRLGKFSKGTRAQKLELRRVTNFWISVLLV